MGLIHGMEFEMRFKKVGCNVSIKTAMKNGKGLKCCLSLMMCVKFYCEKDYTFVLYIKFFMS